MGPTTKITLHYYDVRPIAYKENNKILITEYLHHKLFFILSDCLAVVTGAREDELIFAGAEYTK